MTNIVLLVKDRPRLTEQCLRSLYKNTPQGEFNIVVVDDGSTQEETVKAYGHFLVSVYSNNMRVIQLSSSIGIVGFLRNIGAAASERYFGRGEWLYFSDCDVAFFPNWLQKMTMVAESGGTEILGGCRHPYHGVNLQHIIGRFGWQATDAVAGYSLLMRWDTWDKYGKFNDNQKGVGASEDFEYCQRIVKNGGKVGYIHPPVLAHTGITNTDGKPATGADSFTRVEGVLYE